MPVPWSPARQAQFLGCRRKQVARLSRPLMRHRIRNADGGRWCIWNAEAVPEGASESVKNAWLAFMPECISKQVRPMSRVV